MALRRSISPSACRRRFFLMTDLDIGMEPAPVQAARVGRRPPHDRGKVMTAEMLDAGKEFGRYLDVDGDGIPFRTYPGTHRRRAVLHPRHLEKRLRDHSEQGRLQGQHAATLEEVRDGEDARSKPVLKRSKEPARFGAIYYRLDRSGDGGGARRALAQGIYVNALRLRSFPFQDEIFDFVASHSKVFVIEQNRDAQLKNLCS